MKYLGGIFMAVLLLVAALLLAPANNPMVYAGVDDGVVQAFLPEMIPEVLAAMPATFRGDNVMQSATIMAIGAESGRDRPCWSISTIDSFVLRNNFTPGAGLANSPGHPLRI